MNDFISWLQAQAFRYFFVHLSQKRHHLGTVYREIIAATPGKRAHEDAGKCFNDVHAQSVAVRMQQNQC